MRNKCCNPESVFRHIWEYADDGVWNGDASTIATEFNVGEDEASAVLSEICDEGQIENVYPGTYAITKWRERDDAGEEEVTC
jgi:hypothetical protein